MRSSTIEHMSVVEAIAPWEVGLNPAQSEAVNHDGGALLVVAGAGSGKNRTLASRVARLLADGADPDRVLLLTFSRRASREMLRRADHLGAPRTSARVWGGTFHAIANRLLRRHGAAAGLAEGFTILDQGDATDLVGVVRAELGLAERGRRFPKKDTLLDIYSRVVNSQEPLAKTMKERFPWCAAEVDEVARVFTSFVTRKRERNLVDYDDLLLYWRALLTDSPVADLLRSRFDHVLVDEYQDTNLLQADIVSGLSPEGRNLFVVGDDAQAIYGFRAASAANMAEFPDRFPGCQVVTLDWNYRSTQPILNVANSIMTGARGVFPKELRTARDDLVPGDVAPPRLVRVPEEGAEAGYVCDQVLAHREEGVWLRDMAVLFRAGHHSARLEIELGRRNIPFVKYGGLKFLEAAHVKDLLAFLRLLENPSDEMAWHRVLGMLEGVGPATTRRVMDSLGLPDPTAVTRFVESPPEVPPRAAAHLEVLRATLDDCLSVMDSGVDGGPALEIEAIRARIRPLIENRYRDADARMTDLEQLQSMATATPNRAQFLSELVIDAPSATSDLAGPPHLDDDWLVLSTIHSAKGGEWDVVFVIHAADGNIPSDMALSTREGLEEERRLFYVGLTRARDHLYVTYPMRFYVRRHALDDVHTFSQPTRFVGPAKDLFEEVVVEPTAADLAESAPGPDRVTAQVTSLWS
jgi:DNA helicase II / ATP-dependent DNA helicase PcrA